MPNDTYSTEELRFFGMMVASAAHEWGNVLATVGESAGLLEDLACLAGRGMPLAPERLASVAATVSRQVKRGNALLSNLRRLAHSMDTSAKSVDLAEAGATMAALVGRLAAQRCVSLEAAPGPGACVTCDPYRLSRLLFLCLDYAMVDGQGTNLHLSAAPAGSAPAVAVTGLSDAATAPPAALAEAAAAVGAKIESAPGRLTVIFSPCA